MNPQDINLTAIMEAEGIQNIQHYYASARFSVTLFDGRHGVGRSVGEALANAKKPEAANIRRAA